VRPRMVIWLCPWNSVPLGWADSAVEASLTAMSTFDRATLEVTGVLAVITPTNRKFTIEVRRVGDWQGSPYVSHYPVMIALSRVARVIRRERRWVVRVTEGEASSASAPAVVNEIFCESYIGAVDTAVNYASTLRAEFEGDGSPDRGGDDQ
jgi:hypothetical protein